jgi:hypothetical protein
MNPIENRAKAAQLTQSMANTNNKALVAKHWSGQISTTNHLLNR